MNIPRYLEKKTEDYQEQTNVFAKLCEFAYYANLGLMFDEENEAKFISILLTINKEVQRIDKKCGKIFLDFEKIQE